MKLPHQIVEDFEGVQRNFEAIQQQDFYTGTGAPAFLANKGAYYFRRDTPAVANQRIYVFNGSTWTGIL